MAAFAAIILFILGSIPLEAQPQLVEAQRFTRVGDVSRIHGLRASRIYFVSSGTNERGWYDRTSEAVYRTGGAGWGLEALDAPTAVWSDGLSVFIADRNNRRIVRYDNELRVISDFATEDTSYIQARFGYPVGVAVNGRGDMGVLDEDSQELVVFDRRGGFSFRIGRDARSGLTFSEPVDLATDRAGSWFVLDRLHFSEIDAFGTVITREEHGSDTPRAVDASDDWVVVASASELIFHARDHRAHHTFPVRMFSLESPGAEIGDVLLQGRNIMIVLDGVPVEYELSGFER